jgi:3-oxoacyl-[acyl-carrier protein] reductase
VEIRLDGQVAIVTGAGAGIGRASAEVLAQAGASVVVSDRDVATAEETAAAIRAGGGQALGLGCDVTDEGALTALVARAVGHFGRLDILVNNAGTTKRGDFLSLTDADWADGYALKFFAHVRLARAAWPLLKANGGSIVSIGGTSGRVPTAGFTIGSSVNAAVAAFSKALADLGKTHGVQVNCIHPSYVDTERFARRVKADMERTGQSEAEVREWHRNDIGIIRLGTTDDVAGLIAFMVSQRGRWLHGATISLDGGEVRTL